MSNKNDDLLKSKRKSILEDENPFEKKPLGDKDDDLFKKKPLEVNSKEEDYFEKLKRIKDGRI